MGRSNMAADGLSQMENKKVNKDEAGKEGKEVAKVDPELLIKHPLQNTWTLWFFKMEANRSWEESQMEIASFTSVENFWLEVLLLMIGESFDKHSDDVNGAVVNVRGKGDKLGIWTSNATNSESILKIGHTLKDRLNIPRHVSIGFQAHTDTMVKSGSTAKNRYTV